MLIVFEVWSLYLLNGSRIMSVIPCDTIFRQHAYMYLY